MSFVQVIYASAARHKMTSDELAEILAKARANNSQNGISGMLVYHAGSFLQVIEGPGDVIENLVRKISQDPRHHRIQLLLSEPISEREFDDWSMGFVDTTGLAKQLEGFDDYARDFGASLGDKTMAHKILSRFKDGMWRRYVGE